MSAKLSTQTEPLLIQRHEELEAVAQRLCDARAIEAQLAPLRDRLDEIPVAPYSARYDVDYDMKMDAEVLSLRRQITALEGQLPDRRERALGFDTTLADLRIYRAQWRRILSLTLYFLEINGGELHKIGVTARPIEERVAEIAADLRPHLGSVRIDVVGTWPHRGNVELYFKHRYAQQNRAMDDLTE